MTMQENTLPANVAYTFMTPCKSRGRLNVWFYVFELFVAAFFLVMHEVLLTWIAALMAVHALYRIVSNIKNFQAPCPHCQTIQKRLTQNAKPYTCKTCGHKLEVFGTKLADLDTAPNGAGPVSFNRSQATSQPTSKPLRESDGVKVLSGLISILLIGGWLYYVFGGGLEKQAANGLLNIQNSVAVDAVQEYGIAARNGNKMDKCVQAGLVAAAFLQANDERMYAEWKSVRDRDCKAAGLPSEY